MAYESSRPTKEKRRLYGFMERQRKGGVVGIKKLKKYAEKKGLTAEHGGTSKTASRGYGKKSTMYWASIRGKRGTTIAEVGIKHKKKPRVVWWHVR